MTDSHTHTDITIIGAGLVGATLAAAIATQPGNQSLSITLIDQGAKPSPPSLDQDKPVFDPRVVALSHRSVALLQDIGAWPLVAKQRCCDYQHMRVWDDEGTGALDFHAAELQQASLGCIVENSLLLSAILLRLDELENITLIRQQALADIEQDPQGKHVILSDGRCITPQLLVAADGGHSKVRDLLGMPVKQWSYQQRAIVTTVKSEQSHQHTAWQNFLRSGPLAFLPLEHPSEQYCSIVWSADEARAEALMALPDAEFKQQLGQAFEHRMGAILSIDQRHCFPLIQRHAIDYIAPQVALVGDAAHTIHPLAGQGVNLGLLDAAALAAEVGRACQRKLPLSDASLLRRYQRQRKRHNIEVMLLMESLKRLFGSRDLTLRWLRNQGMRKLNHLGPLKRWLAKQAMG